MKILLSCLAAVSLSVGVICAADAPLLREGLWSIHTKNTSNLSPSQDETTRSMCRNHAWDDRVRANAKRPTCKSIRENFSGGILTIENECTVAATVIRTQSRMTFTGDTSSHSETHSTYTPPMRGLGELTIVMDQKYVGACPAGMEPGDMIDSDGKIIHRGAQNGGPAQGRPPLPNK